MLKKGAVILAGGSSRRFGRDKCLSTLGDKPLILHVLDRVSSVVDKILVVVGSKIQKGAFSRVLEYEAKVVVDRYEGRSPLIGALTGFEILQAEYALLLACDVPFLSPEIGRLLLDLCIDRGAVIPRWPNGYIEPLQAAYNTRLARIASEKALKEKEHDLLSVRKHLPSILYVSTLVLRKYDPELLSFFNVNTPIDLKMAESMVGDGNNSA